MLVLDISTTTTYEIIFNTKSSEPAGVGTSHGELFFYFHRVDVSPVSMNDL